MTVPPDDPTGDRPDDAAPAEAAPAPPQVDDTALGEDTAVPMTDPEPVGRELVAAGGTAGVTAPEDSTEGAGGYDDPYEDVDHEAEAAERNPVRVWQIAAAVLAVLALVFAVIAFTGRDDESTASAPVTTDQESDLAVIVDSDATSAAQIEAKRLQLEKLQQESADAAAAGEQLKADNATLQSDLDAAETRAREAEADATAAVADAEQAADTVAEANRQVAALTGQVESLNQEIASLSSQADRLADQNDALQRANDDLVAANAQVTAQLTALDGVQQKTYQCTLGLVEAVRQQDDPDWWEQNGDATTATCTDAQEALDAYNAQFGG
jgi:FtsZ-binding cell division protein ZapB